MTTENTMQSKPQTAQESAVFPDTDVPVQALFDYLEKYWNLHAFLRDYPSVTPRQALDAMNEKWRAEARELVASDVHTVSGTPRFVGTRVFLYDVFDWLAKGHPLEDFMDAFPTVDPGQLKRTVRLAGQLLECITYEDSLG